MHMGMAVSALGPLPHFHFCNIILPMASHHRQPYSSINFNQQFGTVELKSAKKKCSTGQSQQFELNKYIGPCVVVFFPAIVYARLILHKMTCWPLIRRVLMLTLFPGCTLVAGPKHSTSVPLNAWVAVPLNVDVKEVALVPGTKRLSGLAVKAPLAPQTVEEVDLCSRPHSLFPPTLQMVTPFKSPVTVHLKVKVSPGQVGGAAVNCPATLPGTKYSHLLEDT